MTVKIYKSPVKEIKVIDENKLKITTNQGEVVIFTVKPQYSKATGFNSPTSRS